MPAEPITSRLAQRLTALAYDDLPVTVIDKAKALMADTLLVAAAGQASPLGTQLRAAVTASIGRSRLWFVEGGVCMGPVEAAFVNTLHAGALGYDSVNYKVHADLICLPAAWAMAEHTGASSRELLTAFVAAIETVSRLSRSAIGKAAGWADTAIYGGIGAAVAAGLLLKLPPAQMSHALGLAMAQAAGTQQASLESVASRRLQPAFAARNGVFAAQLAAAGATAPSQALEGRFGLRALYQSGDDKRLFQGLWQDWQLLDTALKRYAICACSQAAVAALEQLQALHHLREDQVLEIVGYVSPFMFRYVGAEFNLQGDLGMLAQHNLRYHLASTFLRGPITFEHLQPQALHDPDIIALLHKVHLRVDPHNDNDFAPATVSLTLLDGQTLRYTQQDVPGSSHAPLSTVELAIKAEQCSTAAGIGAGALLAKVSAFERLASLEAFWY
ncbi:MmgE/PrpD family protein [Pseudomonas typographi]|uniref:MmgE/PrpD family protein n=1 Tax=Pseudomonas typographi TaxID=2715964 RepID=A0ABR7Z8V1_9PSED|nr:MmgE/PrpD family protein [Pseudomonas typographi]MBD1586609.1 MmgE/PrpD family protein [Pseudomonas typographi]MBD1601761.1 MmgE/PrpD family protein [Pseudomonas typographi]